MSYVALKHLLADLTLEAVRDPDRAAWILPARACAELISADHPRVRRSECLRRARVLAAPFGWKPGARDIAKLEEAGLLIGRGEFLTLTPAFVPYLDYYTRHTERLVNAIRLLRHASASHPERSPSHPERERGSPAAGTRAVEDAVRVAAVLFNTGLFFECHEWGEGLWKAATGEPRDFYHGLVQAAAAFYHHEKHNRHGSRTLLGKGLRRLEPYPDHYLGIDVGRLRADLGPWAAHFAGGPRPAGLPRIHALPEDVSGSSAGVRAGRKGRGNGAPLV